MIKLAAMFSLLFLLGWGIAWWAMPRLRRFIGTGFVVNYLIILNADLFLNGPWSFWIVTFIATFATIRGREDAMCRMMLLTPLMPAVTLAVAVGGSFIGIYSSITCVVLACALACATSPPLRDRPVRGFTVEDGFILLLFVIFGLLAQRTANATGLIRSITTMAGTYLLPYFLMRNNVRTTQQGDRMIACLLAAGIPAVIIAVFEVKSGWAVTDVLSRYATGSDGIAASSKVRGGYVRASGTFGNPLILSYFMQLMVIAMFTARDWFTKTSWRWMVLLSIVGFLAPQSRGAVIALVPGAIVLLLAKKKFGSAAALLTVSGLGALGILLLRNFSAYVADMLGGGTGVAGHADYRGLLLERGIQEVWKRPFVGTSITNALNALRDITQGEGIIDLVNTYLWIALVSGVVGLAIFLFLFLSIIRKLIARAKRGEQLESTRSLRAFLLSSLVMTMINLTSMSFIERFAFLVVVLAVLSRVTSAALIRAKRKKPQPAMFDLDERVPAPA